MHLKSVILFSTKYNINLLGDNVFNYMLKFVVNNHYLSEVTYSKKYNTIDISTKHNDGNNGFEPHSTYKTISYNNEIKILERKDKIKKLSNYCDSSN